MMYDIDYLISLFNDFGISISPNMANRLNLFYDLLIEYNNKFNLTSITEYKDVSIKHFLDSAIFLKLLTHKEGVNCINIVSDNNRSHFNSDPVANPININSKSRLLDIGSGGGFPGLVISILLPDTNIYLLEATEKKCNFLEIAIKELGLSSTYVINDRAESIGRNPDYREGFDICFSRAVSSFNVLLEYALPLLKIEGTVVLYKGNNYLEEINNYKVVSKVLGGDSDINIYNYSLPDNYGKRALLYLNKIADTPDSYPRRPGIPTKRPLK